MDDLNDIYNDLIMEHSMNSYNKKKLAQCDFCEMDIIRIVEMKYH